MKRKHNRRVFVCACVCACARVRVCVSSSASSSRLRVRKSSVGASNPSRTLHARSRRFHTSVALVAVGLKLLKSTGDFSRQSFHSFAQALEFRVFLCFVFRVTSCSRLRLTSQISISDLPLYRFSKPQRRGRPTASISSSSTSFQLHITTPRPLFVGLVLSNTRPPTHASSALKLRGTVVTGVSRSILSTTTTTTATPTTLASCRCRIDCTKMS